MLALKQIMDLLEQHKKPMARILYEEIKDDTNPLRSKNGGLGYWENSGIFPEHLRMIAQINFAEIKGLPELYPTTGILQFFIAEDDWGMDFKKPFQNDAYQVIYWPEPSMDKYDSSYAEYFLESWDSPHERNMYINFKNTEMEMCSPIDEYSFEQITHETVLEDDIVDELYDHLNTEGSKIGGFANFTQSDPRCYLDLEKTFGKKPEYEVLLQLDSDSEHMMWGDVGVAVWLITREDLVAKRFDRVLFNWDCC